MLANIFKAFLITSIVGSALAVIITLLKPVTKKIFGYSWHYYIWLAVLFVMIAPVRFSLPQSVADIPVANTQAVHTEHITETSQANAVNDGQIVNTANTIMTAQRATDFIGKILDNRMNYLGIIWLLGTVLMLMTSINGYIWLIMKIRRNSVIISCPETANYTDKKITVRKGADLSSPFMLGIFRPTLVLPDRELSTEQLNNILRHEMTHFRRKDIMYKWFTLFVRSVHWFNPIVYYVAKQINNECEISCDLSVVSQMNGDEQLGYVNTILSLASSDRVKRVPLTTQMASGKKALKRRFTMIKNVKKTSRFMSVLSAVIAVVMLGTTVFASGVLSDIATDDYTIEITNNGEKIELANKPFIENGEVYVPLRETFEKVGVMEHPESKIEWDNGKIDLCIAYYADAIVIAEHQSLNNGQGVDSVSFIFNYTIEIGKADITEKNIVSILEVPNKAVMNNAPILRGSNTYIPYSYINYMLHHNWQIDYRIYDKDGKDVTIELMNARTEPLTNPEALKIAPNYGNEQMMCYEIIENFYKECFSGNVETALNTYCTDDFGNNQSDNDVFIAQLGTVYSIYLYPNDTYHVKYSLDYPNGDEQDFEAVFSRQYDGRFLIDGMWSTFE